MNATWIDAISWTLVHFVWQGLVVGAVLVGVLRFVKARYAAMTLAMMALVIVAGTTLAVQLNTNDNSAHRSVQGNGPASTQLEHSSDPLSQAEGGPSDQNTPDQTTPDQTTPDHATPDRATPDSDESSNASNEPAAESSSELSSRLTANAASVDSSNLVWQLWLVAAWLLGVALLSLRLGIQYRGVRKLRRSSEELPDDSPWRQRLIHLIQKLRISSPIRILTSQFVDVPLVIGIFKPVIVVPISMLTNMPPSQVDAILLHELAHVKRRDFLVNLLQSAVETVFFYHPVVWWISQGMREEREHCCDDLASASCEDVLQYARALTALEESRSSMRPCFPLAAAADGGRPGSLLRRIQRLVGSRTDSKSSQDAWIVPLPLIGGLLLVALMLTGLTDKSTNAISRMIGQVVPSDVAQQVPDWSQLRVTDFSGEGQRVICIHTVGDIEVLVIATPQPSWNSMHTSSGVNRKKGIFKSGYTSFSQFRWDDSALRLEFDTDNPMQLRLKTTMSGDLEVAARSLHLDGGRVIYWNGADGSFEQRATLRAPLPKADGNTPEMAAIISGLRKQIAVQFPQKLGPVVVADRAGEWKITENARLEILQQAVHGADVMTTAVLRWPAVGDRPATHCRLHVAVDYFANREPWRIAWETGKPVLWIASGDHRSPTEVNDITKRLVANMVRRVDFGDPNRIVVREFNGWPIEGRPSPECMNALEKQIDVQPMTRLANRSYHWAVAGEDPVEPNIAIHVYLDGNGKCRVGRVKTRVVVDALLPTIVAERERVAAQWARSNQSRDQAEVPLSAIAHPSIIAAAEVLDTTVDEAIDACRKAGIGPTP